MTETSILPGASLESDAGNSMVPPPADVEETGGDNRRRLMILGLVAAIVVIAAAAYLLLHKGTSSTPSTTAAPPAPVTATATHGGSTGTPAKTVKTSTAKAGTKLPRKSKTPLVRDPFKALINAPTGSGSGAAGTQSGTTTNVAPQSSTAPATSTTTTTTTVPVTNPTSPTTGAAVTSGTPLWIQLVSVKGTKAAIFDVGYAHHKFRRFEVIAPSPTSTRGTVFDGEFALLGIQGDEVTIQVGDDTPFDLTHGVSHNV